MVLENFLNKIRKNCLHFNKGDFSPRYGLAEATIIFCAWSIPAYFFVWIIHWLSKYMAAEYFNKAIAEGIGPHLWNIMGVFGFSLFGMSLMFPTSKFLSLIANRVLVNTYALGSLMFGLLLGQISSRFLTASLEKWSRWLNVGGFFVLVFILVFGINFFAWYLSFLIYNRNGKSLFLEKAKRMDLSCRVCFGLVVIIVPICLMFARIKA